MSFVSTPIKGNLRQREGRFFGLLWNMFEGLRASSVGQPKLMSTAWVFRFGIGVLAHGQRVMLCLHFEWISRCFFLSFGHRHAAPKCELHAAKCAFESTIPRAQVFLLSGSRIQPKTNFSPNLPLSSVCVCTSLVHDIRGSQSFRLLKPT